MQTKSLRTLKVSLLLVSVLTLYPSHAFPMQSEDEDAKALRILPKSLQPAPDCSVHTRWIGGMGQAIYETVETHQDKDGKAFKHSYTYLGTGPLLCEKTDDAALLKKLFHKDCINCVKRKGTES